MTHASVARAICAASAIAAISACSSGLQPAVNASGPGIVPEGVRGLQSYGPSWMTPDKRKKNGPLLYISDTYENALDVYSYPKLTKVGQVTGLTYPDGLCNDKKGNIWVANNLGQSLTEFAHGGTSPKATLSDPNYFPVSCSVDPITGNLAVGNNGAPGDVAVYAHASGSPTGYRVANMFYVLFVGYDNKGNLFVDGTEYSGGFDFAELAKHKRTFKPVTLSGMKVRLGVPGNIRFDGKHVAVGDQYYQQQQTSAIYQTTGAGGKIVGVTPLLGSVDVSGFTITKGVVIGPDSGSGLPSVGLWRYPAGGPPTKTLTGFLEPSGSAISE